MKKMIMNVSIVLLSSLLYFSFIDVGENLARTQNNFNLDTVIQCTMSELDYNKKTYADYTSTKLTQALNICAKNQRSLGITGDIFVMRKDDRQVFWDSSLDCKPDEPTDLFLTETGICKLFNDPKTCLKAADIMFSGEPDGSFTWLFDDDIEYIDYRYLEHTVDGELKIVEIEGRKYIIAQGTQKDEVMNAFFLVNVLLILSSLIMLIIINY